MFTTEIWGLALSVLVQDCPFVAVRIYALAKYNVFTFSIVYFTCKNLLVISLVIYRLIVICAQQSRNDDNGGDEDDKGGGKRRKDEGFQEA